MRCFILYILICIQWNVIAQSKQPVYHLGSTFVFSNQIRTDQISFSDSSGLYSDFAINNKFGIKELNDYAFGLNYQKQNSVYTFNYQYFQENVISKQNLSVAVQKQVSSNWYTRVSIHYFKEKYIRHSNTEFGSSVALMYSYNNKIFLQNTISNIPLNGSVSQMFNRTAFQYKIDDFIATTFQYSIGNEMDGALGLLYSKKSYTLHLEHHLNRKVFGVGFGLKTGPIFINFVFYTHQILGNSYFTHLKWQVL
ncbi:MAG: hypothetical protein ACPG6V_03560 [Flavobacteriales bacterium]